MPHYRLNHAAQYKLLLILALSTFAFDQATKLAVIATLPLGSFFAPDNIVVIPGFFNIVHVGNTGAAWSLFSGNSGALAIVGAAALFLIWLFRATLELSKRQSQLAFGLIIGGIIGNVLDRLRLGHVVDFLDFNFFGYHWPSFNVADSGICVGVFLYVISSLKNPKKQD